MDVVSYHLSKTPMAMESQSCSQGVIHGGSRVQVCSGEQPQQEGTDCSLTGPVQGCSLGTAVALRGAAVALPGRSAAVGGRQHGGTAEEGSAEQSRRDAAGPRQPRPQQHQRRHPALLHKGTVRRNRRYRKRASASAWPRVWVCARLSGAGRGSRGRTRQRRPGPPRGFIPNSNRSVKRGFDYSSGENKAWLPPAGTAAAPASR